MCLYVCMYKYNDTIESLQSVQLVEHNILGEMKSQFFIGMLLRNAVVSC